MRRVLLALALAALLPDAAAAQVVGRTTLAARPQHRPAPGEVVLCGDPRLFGTVPDPVEGPGYCGIPEPVRVKRIEGVALLTPITVNCRTARRFADWVFRGPEPAARRLGTRLVGIRTSGSYACRPRNNRPGGRLSEHAAGNAVDVAGFVLADGRMISVFSHWDEPETGAFLRAGWRAGCSLFGTTLGPEADAMHRDHFHFDTASREHGPYCR